MNALSHSLHCSTDDRRCALAVMAKAPLAGTVKTRLVPPLTAAEAAGLSACFIRDMAENIARLDNMDGLDGVIAYTPDGAQAAFDGLLPAGFKLLPQRGATLGERLLHATEDLLACGYESLCLINSDSPTLPAELLRDALTRLAQPGDRVVLGQSADGGYYLIGLKRPHRALFERIAWSTADVLAHTVERAAEINLAVELLPAWYDVDDEASLHQLCAELFGSSEQHAERNGLRGYAAPHTRRYLAQLLRAEPEHILAQRWSAAED